MASSPSPATEDLLELFGLDRVVASQQTVDGPAKDVLAALPGAPDDVARTTGLDARIVAVALAELELAGLACEGDGIFRPAS
jgi:predicted Rossmann fold nucleotide-binding protein DprA/Smf involved in DNA uptake